LKYVPTGGEHPVELLTQWEMELKALEGCLNNPKPEGGCQEIAMPEETHQHDLQLGETRIELVEELTGVNLSKEVAEQKFSGKTAELESATEWPANVTRDEINMGYQDDTPIEHHAGLHSSSLHKENQSMKQLEEVI
jgi:hypothetical protein